MKNNKKGISLIVLVITILVMIILAGVVIVSLQYDNPVEKAKEAKKETNIANLKQAIVQYVANLQLKTETELATARGKLVILTDNYNSQGEDKITETAQEVDFKDRYFKLQPEAGQLLGVGELKNIFGKKENSEVSVFVNLSTGDVYIGE